MRLGILSDTHDALTRTQSAVELLREAGAEALIHCGDLTSPPIVSACAALPFWFVLGNNDIDSVVELQSAAADSGAVCLDWHGLVELAGRKIGVVHGHRRSDVRQILSQQPDYLLCGHSHVQRDELVDGVRWINPGALFRAREYTVALLDLETGALQSLSLT